MVDKMQTRLSVNIGKLRLKNPVMVASGTFGYAEEFAAYLDLKKLGAIVTKTVTLDARTGNLAPRTCETPAGMLNSIGLENPGIDKFIEEKLSLLSKIGIPIIVSIGGVSKDEFVELAKRLNKVKEADAIELNISCPNIKTSQMISQDPRVTYAVVRGVRKVTKKTLITKLSPSVADITQIATAAQRAGTDAVSLINTLSAMSIDVDRRKPKIASVTAGLSGPAIRPLAVRMVWETYQKIKIPIIGMGGIMDTYSALEFFIAGATCVAIGTANFINPRVTLEIISGIRQYLIRHKIKNIRQLIGGLKS